MNPQNQQPTTTTTAKSRPSASCIPCRNRKVKCTRTTPCSKCVSRNHPEECVYTASDVDREAMRQADVITQLRGRVRNLRSVVDAGPGGGRGTGIGTWTGMGEGGGGDEEVVYKALYEGSVDVVEQVIGMLRCGGSIDDIARYVKRQQQSQIE